MDSKQKALKKEYQQSHTPMGVFQIRNVVNERVFVGKALNLPGIFNRHRLELRMGSHKNLKLQAEWNEFGADKFAFEILDELTPVSDPLHDYREDLEQLEDLWLEKLQPYSEQGYNEPKKTKEQRLRMIAENRLAADRERDE
ncbi:MAG: GIY-YIG nuclease family protein [Acidobacteriota bacterium]|nr:GIY-YIG nuclease family protein [Acidobacteriota bacterium]